METTRVLVESIGWLATTVVVASFFFANPETLRKVQICGSILWLLYGLVIGSMPVIVANALVFTAATWTTLRAARSRRFSHVSAASPPP